MVIEKGSLWKFHEKGCISIIPTNGVVNVSGDAVCGAGIALQAKQYYPSFPKLLGEMLKVYNNHVFYFSELNLISFPTKYNWRDKSDINLIKRSATELKLLIQSLDDYLNTNPIVMPKVGTGLGQLTWEEVLPILEAELGDVDNLIILDND